MEAPEEKILTADSEKITESLKPDEASPLVPAQCLYFFFPTSKGEEIKTKLKIFGSGFVSSQLRDYRLRFRLHARV